MIVLALVIILDLATKAILQSVNFLVSASRTIPGNFVQIAKIVLGNQLSFKENFFDFTLYGSDAFVLLGAREVNTVVANDHRDAGLVGGGRAVGLWLIFGLLLYCFRNLTLRLFFSGSFRLLLSDSLSGLSSLSRLLITLLLLL